MREKKKKVNINFGEQNTVYVINDSNQKGDSEASKTKYTTAIGFVLAIFIVLTIILTIASICIQKNAPAFITFIVALSNIISDICKLI